VLSINHNIIGAPNYRDNIDPKADLLIDKNSNYSAYKNG